ncbi:PapB family radical SAM/SPASM ranthipeptide maturase [Enterococcus phoeniculicola]|uniref:Radical SAM additional 4Fe4S-binding SPASM domain-containing protein n=1 Tax=Enterococcus phoeniculicola ATCC BAA-412 TaxID=1158610 RepID=R3W626_9ENTE|nr:radical SAM protein [Enterococcus phoeniculicola]EOL43022.1 radical SAM additional 4Fe4S-binding SPASM domain-containing protein [Enterococcus phoeniculicola ATCC BAA-412]EOT76620.1 hypothetical protein I589_01577 [Enterococcus phoeniculicola ATCC BAA-412]
MNNQSLIEFEPYKIFRNNGKNYVFKINDNKLFQIDSRTEQFLREEGKTIEQGFHSLRELFTQEEYLNLIQGMMAANFFKNQIEESVFTDIPKNGVGLSSLTLMLIQECNMKCSYCYGEGGEYFNKGKMSIDTAIKAVDYLIKESKEKELLVAFFGGEPLMNFRLIKEVVKYCKGKEISTNKIFRFTITTNGTLINKRIEDFLVENNVMIQISLDGNKKQHDKNRFFENRRGSYDLILDRTKSLRERTRVSGRATLTSENLNYTEIYNHLNDLGFSAIPMAVAENMIDDEAYEIRIKEFIRLIHYCKELIDLKKYDDVVKIPMIYGILQKLEFPEERQVGCNVGQGVYAVDIDGSLFPCHRFVSKENFKIGDLEIGVENVQEFKDKQHVLNHVKCDSCWARNLCLGGCPFENYEQTGFMEKASSRYCKFMKMTSEEIVKLYLELNNEDRKKLFH